MFCSLLVFFLFVCFIFLVTLIPINISRKHWVPMKLYCYAVVNFIITISFFSCKHLNHLYWLHWFFSPDLFMWLTPFLGLTINYIIHPQLPYMILQLLPEEYFTFCLSSMWWSRQVILVQHHRSEQVQGPRSNRELKQSWVNCNQDKQKNC